MTMLHKHEWTILLYSEANDNRVYKIQCNGCGPKIILTVNWKLGTVLVSPVYENYVAHVTESGRYEMETF